MTTNVDEVRIAQLEDQLAAERVKTKALGELLESLRVWEGAGGVAFLLGRADIILDLMIVHIEKHSSTEGQTMRSARELRENIASFMKVARR